MRASRYLAEFLRSKVDFVFGLQGGAVVHLFDACERFGPKPIYCHHEQGAAFAAGAYARVHGYGACIVTTGPGATNAITPLLGAWQNFTPMMFISGQVRVDQMRYGSEERIGGMQWAPILDIVRPLTKTANLALDGEHVEIALKHAYTASRTKPYGPSWVDIPLDVQWAEV